MASYTVTKVRKEWSANRDHRHIEGVITNAGVHYTRAEVVRSLQAGSSWETSCDGYRAAIRSVNHCPKSGCAASPYITTNPDSTTKDNLENLPEG